MVTLYFAATAPINPPSEKALTQAQVWAGLQRKVRHANEFVPPITSCIVNKEEANVVHRTVVFEGVRELTEVCTEYAPHRVDFTLADGSEVTNIVGLGPSGNDDDLHLTYAFKWIVADAEEGSKEAKEALDRQQKVSLPFFSEDLAIGC